MNADLIFQLSGLTTIPFWILMIFFPKWSVTQRVMGSPWVIAPAALLYSIFVFPAVANVLPAVMRPELAGIQTLLGTPMGTTIAWVHFLAFDLFVGRWVYLESQHRGFSAWWISPILFFVLMLGPLGALIFLVMRGFPNEGSPQSRELQRTGPPTI